MIDLSIQSNLREWLSLTEYIFSCYGARKGVMYTVVWTSDTGYLTHRLVAVVQHIIVRRTDWDTIRDISVSLRNWVTNVFCLIGCVLVDDIYRDTMHCHSKSRYWYWTCQSIHNLSSTTNIYSNSLLLVGIHVGAINYIMTDVLLVCKILAQT